MEHSTRSISRGTEVTIVTEYIPFLVTEYVFLHSNIKDDILKNVEEPNSWWSLLTSKLGKAILCKSIGTNNCLITSIFQNILYYVQHKETHTGLGRHEAEQMTICGVNYPFNAFHKAVVRNFCLFVAI